MTTEREQQPDLGLDRAFRAARDRFDGSHPDADVTLRRALLATRKRARSRRLRLFVVLPLAAALAASTAWAGATGRLVPALSSVVDAFHGERARVESTMTPAPPRAPGTAPAVSAPVVEAAAAPVEPPPPSEPASSSEPPAAIVATTGRVAASAASASTPAPAPSSSATTADPNAALFAEAHRLHFTERDPVRAIVAWDRYLTAAPAGKFAHEARYNRALALVRVGRHAEAKRELEAFADGAHGDYRRADARALLDALERDE